MDDGTTELIERFERYCDTKDASLPADVLAELQSMLRLYSISAEELDFKWQAYSIKMGGEDKMDLKSASRKGRRHVRYARGLGSQHTAGWCCEWYSW
jgi:hypothetical protein